MTTHSLPFIPRKSRPFCSTDDASSCTHRQRNQTCLVHQKIHRLAFRPVNSLFAGNQSVLLSLQPVETRAARRVTNPAVLVGELDVIFSSAHARRTERFYSTITRRKDLNNRRRLDLKVDGQDWTSFFDLPNNLMAGDQGNIDERNYITLIPDSELFGSSDPEDNNSDGCGAYGPRGRGVGGGGWV